MRRGDLVLTNDGYFGIVEAGDCEPGKRDRLVTTGNGLKCRYDVNDIIPLPIQLHREIAIFLHGLSTSSLAHHGAVSNFVELMRNLA